MTCRSVDTAGRCEGRVREGSDFFSDCDILAEVDIAGPGVVDQRLVEGLVKALQFANQECARAVAGRGVESGEVVAGPVTDQGGGRKSERP